MTKMTTKHVASDGNLETEMERLLRLYHEFKAMT